MRFFLSFHLNFCHFFFAISCAALLLLKSVGAEMFYTNYKSYAISCHMPHHYHLATVIVAVMRVFKENYLCLWHGCHFVVLQATPTFCCFFYFFLFFHKHTYIFMWQYLSSSRCDILMSLATASFVTQFAINNHSFLVKNFPFLILFLILSFGNMLLQSIIVLFI